MNKSKLAPIRQPKMAAKPKVYNHSNRVIDGQLCKECNNNNSCKDNKCPLHKFRKEMK
jgi:hypothetical protein